MDIEMHDLANAHKRLALLRQLAKADLSEVAEAIGGIPAISADDLARWEREGLPLEKNLWCHTIVERAAACFHCSLRWLREGVGEAPTEVTLAKIIVVEAECGPCRGSGVYPGMDAYPDGPVPPEDFVVCRTCNGEGKCRIEYIPFNRRYIRPEVAYVSTNHIARRKGTVSYAEFLGGFLP